MSRFGFLSTPSARRATCLLRRWQGQCKYFYPRPPRGGRLKPYFQKSCDFEFLSTPSARRATRGMRRYCCPRTYFYPRPPRGGRLGVIGQYGHRLIFLSTPSARRATELERSVGGHIQISIHALREEGDFFGPFRFARAADFYPRPPRGGRPCRRRSDRPYSSDFYPRPPRGGRPLRTS